MEIYKELKTQASKEFESLLNSQLSKTKNLIEGKIIEGKITKISDKFVFLFIDGLKSEPILDINELKSMGLLEKVNIGEKLAVIEAMKMNHTITAHQDGLVEQLFISEGEQLELGASLMIISNNKGII